MQKLKAQWFYLVFVCVSWLVSMLPAKLTWPLFKKFSYHYATKNSLQRSTVAKNMQQVTGKSGSELDKIVEQAFESYALYWHELFLLKSKSRDEIVGHVTFENQDVLEKVLSEGKGAILALPHVGNWELAGARMTTINHPISVVAEQLEPLALFNWFTKTRVRVGMEVFPLNAEVTKPITTALSENKPVGLLSDRDISQNGIEVDFFGVKASMPGGPALISVRSGAPILPTGCFLNADRTVTISFGEPFHVEKTSSLRAAVNEGTQRVTKEMEKLITRAPEQWHLFQPVWSDV